MTLSIIDAINCPDKAIVGLVNYKKRKVYLHYAYNCLEFLMREVKLLKDGKHSNAELQADVRDLTFEVYLNCDDTKGHIYGRYMQTVWSGLLVNGGGWSLYNDIKPMTFRKKLTIELEPGARRGYSVFCWLITSRGTKIKIKTFKSMPEAEAFMNDTSLHDLLRIALSTIASY
jgi:hypothetical protein